MKLSGELSLDLGNLFSGDDDMSEIIKEEILTHIRAELRNEFKTNVVFVGAMKKLRTKAAMEIIDKVTKWTGEGEDE